MTRLRRKKRRRRACPTPSRPRRTRGGQPWIQREGKLGGPGYTDRSEAERHDLLECSVDRFGYRSTLGSLLVLLRPAGTTRHVQRVVRADIAWLREHFA